MRHLLSLLGREAGSGVAQSTWGGGHPGIAAAHTAFSLLPSTCSRGSALPAQERSRAVRASARFYRFKANTEVSSTDPAAPRLAKVRWSGSSRHFSALTAPAIT